MAVMSELLLLGERHDFKESSRRLPATSVTRASGLLSFFLSLIPAGWGVVVLAAPLALDPR